MRETKVSGEFFCQFEKVPVPPGIGGEVKCVFIFVGELPEQDRFADASRAGDANEMPAFGFQQFCQKASWFFVSAPLGPGHPVHFKKVSKGRHSTTLHVNP
jgi:hypothetical protein